MDDAKDMRVIVLPPTRADGLAMGKLFGSQGIAFETVSTVPEVCRAIERNADSVILAEEALLEDPTPLVHCIAKQAVWSDLPIIVLSRSGSESSVLANLLTRLGNVSVVERPMRASTLVSLVKSSHRARARQYEVREYLAAQDSAQREIREGERRYRALIDNVTDYAIFMTDPQGRVSSWNSGAEAVLGYSSEDVLGRSVEIFESEDTSAADPTQQRIQQARQLGKSSSAGWHLSKTGKRLFLEGLLVAVRDDTDELLGFAYFLRDITDKHRIESEREQLLTSERTARGEAERASRTKDEFLATLSHELRTPLNAMLGWTQVLRRTSGLPADALKGLQVIERNARSQSQIIEDLLDMSSIISGKVRLHVQRVDLSTIVNTTIDAVRPAAQAKSIRLQVVLDPLAGPVRGDPNRLQQILWNLLTNAVKFTPANGRVTVTLARVNSHLEIEVVDNGEGIDPAFLPHVFDRFRQADASITRRHGGLGLGLSISKQLVELHGGTISAKSAGKDKGTTFRVAFPLMATNADPSELEESRHHPTRSTTPNLSEVPPVDLRGVTVLVVDDEPDSRSLIKRVLEDNQARVTTAASAKEAIQRLDAEAPDVLVSDIGMPGEDGYSLIRRVRTMNHPRSGIPAIALTAYARIEDRVKAIHAGYQLHLSKPVEAIELVAMIDSLVKRTVER